MVPKGGTKGGTKGGRRYHCDERVVAWDDISRAVCDVTVSGEESDAKMLDSASKVEDTRVSGDEAR